MGRQHTMYMSDVTWSRLELLKQDEQSMSAVVRQCIDLGVSNKGEFDLFTSNELKIESLKKGIKRMTQTIDCIIDLYDEPNIKYKEFYNTITKILQEEGRLE